MLVNVNQPTYPKPPRPGIGTKDNSNLNEIFTKSENPRIWDKNIPDNTYSYKMIGWISVSDISSLLISAKVEYGDVEIHVNPSTCALVYRNRINDNLLLSNLKLICEDDEICPTLADIYKGAFDLKHKKFWINSNESVNIVINKSVEKGYSYIVSNDEVIGYYEHAI